MTDNTWQQQWTQIEFLSCVSVHDEYWEVEDKDGNRGVGTYSCGELVEVELD